MSKKQEPDYRSFVNNNGGAKKKEDALHDEWVTWRNKRKLPWYMVKPQPNDDRKEVMR